MPRVIKPRIVTITAVGETPPVMVVAAGQDVTWNNTDTKPHTVSPYSSTPIPAGGSFSHVFPAVGEYTYTIDGTFTGTVSVN